MRKILVISDSHGSLNNIRRVMKRESEIEFVIHAGDAQGDDDEIREITGCPTYIVCGNCDHFSRLPGDFKVDFGPHCIMVTHGHDYFVSLGSRMLKEAARQKGCNIVVFGHTHRPLIEDRNDGILVLNPGSISYPRQDGREPSYLILEMEENCKIRAEIKYLKK